MPLKGFDSSASPENCPRGGDLVERPFIVHESADHAPDLASRQSNKSSGVPEGLLSAILVLQINKSIRTGYLVEGPREWVAYQNGPAS